MLCDGCELIWSLEVCKSLLNWSFFLKLDKNRWIEKYLKFKFLKICQTWSFGFNGFFEYEALLMSLLVESKSWKFQMFQKLIASGFKMFQWTNFLNIHSLDVPSTSFINNSQKLQKIMQQLFFTHAGIIEINLNVKTNWNLFFSSATFFVVRFN